MKQLFCLAALWFITLAPATKAEIVDLSAGLPLAGAYLLPQPKAEFVRVELLFSVGEVDYDGPEGLAHYLEHLVWYSADKAHGEVGKNRVANAWTNIFHTNYWNSAGPEKLSDMLAVSAATFGPINLQPSFSISERDVVAREFDLRTADNPNRLLYTQMRKALMPDNAASRSVIGTRDSIAQITPEAATAFKDIWYHPQNANLLISGPVTAKEVIPLLQQHFAALPGGEPSHRSSLKQPVWDGRHVETSITHPKLSEPKFSIMFTAPPPEDMSVAEINQTVGMLSQVLDSSGTGTLRKALYYDDFIVDYVDVYASWGLNDTMTLTITGAPDPDVDLTDAITAAKDLFLGLEGVNAESFAKLHAGALDKLTREIDQVETARDIAFTGLRQGGAPFSTDTYLTQFKDVTLADLNRLLRVFQTQSISVTGVAHPEDQK